jgi:Trypsin
VSHAVGIEKQMTEKIIRKTMNNKKNHEIIRETINNNKCIKDKGSMTTRKKSGKKSLAATSKKIKTKVSKIGTAIVGGQNDVNTPKANAVVRLGGFCTGTLITSDLVLTAGHCITHPLRSPYEVVDMTSYMGKLYAATRDNHLVMKEIFPSWREIGHAPGVVAMTAGGDKLFAATRDNNLSVRRISEQDETWNRIGIGQAEGVVAMTSHQDKIYAAKANGDLVTRRISEQAETWNRIGHALTDSVTMTAASGTGGIPKLYAATETRGLFTRRISEQAENWNHIGHVGEPAGLAFVGNKLFLVTRDRHLSMRDIIESDISWDYAEPDREFAPRIPGKWYNLPSPFPVNFGNDSQRFNHRVNAIQYCVAGFADIILLKLASRVPSHIARRMRVLLQMPDGVTNPTEFWRRQEFKLVGWGGGATIRQTTTARNGLFPGQSMHGPVLMNLQNVTGGTQPGDSGSPLIWGNPEPCVIGVCQTSGAQYFVTFSNGGTDSLALVNPNIARWLRQFT